MRIREYLYLSPLLLFLGVMIIYPMSQVVHTTFTEFGLSELIETFSPGQYPLRSLMFTFRVAAVTTLLSTIIGYSIALVLRMRGVYVGSITELLRLPLFVPYIAIGFIWRALLGARGHATMIINAALTPLGFEPLTFVGQGIGINIAHLWLYIPIVFIMMYGGYVGSMKRS